MCNPFPGTGVTGGSNPYEERKNCSTPRWSARGKRKKKPCPGGGQGSTGWKSRAGAWMLADLVPPQQHHRSSLLQGLVLHPRITANPCCFPMCCIFVATAGCSTATVLLVLLLRGVPRQRLYDCCYCWAFCGKCCTGTADAGCSTTTALRVLLLLGVLRQLRLRIADIKCCVRCCDALTHYVYRTALTVRSKHNAGRRPRMGWVNRPAHEKQCNDEEGGAIWRNEGE